MTSNEECRNWYKEGYDAAMGDIQSCSRKAAEEIAKRVWESFEKNMFDTCVLVQGGECREGVGACREHVVDAFTLLISRHFAEVDE